jgi:transposase
MITHQFIQQRIIKDWLQHHDIEIMIWPPYSPDLNPIENLWAILKAAIYREFPELNTMPSNTATLEYLIECAQITWGRIGEDILNRLIDTMEHRVKAILYANGWYTKY